MNDLKISFSEDRRQHSSCAEFSARNALTNNKYGERTTKDVKTLLPSILLAAFEVNDPNTLPWTSPNS